MLFKYIEPHERLELGTLSVCFKLDTQNQFVQLQLDFELEIITSKVLPRIYKDDSAVLCNLNNQPDQRRMKQN